MNLIKFMLVVYAFIMLGCSQFKESSLTKISIMGRDINLGFEQNEIFVRGYMVNDYEKRKKDGLTYQNVFISEEINQTKKLVVENYKSKGVYDNNAYYFLINAENPNKPSASFISVGFCLHETNVIQMNSKESTEDFIERCHALK